MLVIITAMSVACAGSRRPDTTLRVTRHDSAAVAIIELSISPSAMARGLANVDTLEPDREIVPSEHSVTGYVADVIGFADGSIVTLDRQVDSVRVFSSAGERRAAWEIRYDSGARRPSPIAVVGVGDHMVVLNPQLEGALLSYSATGQLTVRYAGSADADWESLLARGPLVYYATNIAEGPEDYTRRLGGLNESTFVFEMRPAEGAARGTAPVLLTFDARLRIRDTLARWHVAPPRRATAITVGDTNRFERALFAPSSHVRDVT